MTIREQWSLRWRCLYPLQNAMDVMVLPYPRGPAFRTMHRAVVFKLDDMPQVSP